MFESILDAPMNPDEIRSFVGTSLEKFETEEEMAVVSEILKEVSAEVASMYTIEVLDYSSSWHALNQSTMKDNTKELPENVEQGVAKVITNLLERKLKPLTR